MRPVIVVALAILMATSVAVAGKRNRKASGLSKIVASLPVQFLDEEEQADLLFLREEEKLARDVYLALHETWGTRVFKKIARSEQKHMDAVLALLRKYSIPDPAAGNVEGEFTDPALQDLYDRLMEKGTTSLADALVVGATIEDMDIFDLMQDIANTDNEDLLTVYQSLLRGSRNHLRAFAKVMEANDVAYEAQYITPAEYDAIVESAKERGTVDARGERSRSRKGRRGR